jgi:hypothetical protein
MAVTLETLVPTWPQFLIFAAIETSNRFGPSLELPPSSAAASPLSASEIGQISACGQRSVEIRDVPLQPFVPQVSRALCSAHLN